MTAPQFATGDTCILATSCLMTKQSYGIAPHRADVAQLVAPCTVTAVHEKKGAWPLSVRFVDGTEIVATTNEIVTVLVAAERTERASESPNLGDRAPVAREAAA